LRRTDRPGSQDQYQRSLDRYYRTLGANHKSEDNEPVEHRVYNWHTGVPDPSNLYSEIKTDNFAPATKGDLTRVYVPNRAANTVSVIDPSTMKVVDTFSVGLNPQHVVPSYDLKTLWVTNNAEGTTDGTLTPIDPKTGKPGQAVTVDDPYNMYFTPDGKYAIVVAERLERLDFRDPHTFALEKSVHVACLGVDHIDFSADGRYLIARCEFGFERFDPIAQQLVFGQKICHKIPIPKGRGHEPQRSTSFRNVNTLSLDKKVSLCHRDIISPMTEPSTGKYRLQ